MNKYHLHLLGCYFFIASTCFAQAAYDKPNPNFQIYNYNKWTIEVDYGMAKGLKPYAKDYYASYPGKFLGGLQFNHYGIAARWMFSPKFGIKTQFSFDDLKNLSGSGSKPFKVKEHQVSFEGVVNASRLFDVEENLKRFGLLFHFGIQGSQISPQMGINKGKKELNGGWIIGMTPQVLIFKKFSLFLDFKLDGNIRQHFNWDGSYANTNDNLTGSKFTTSFGLTYSLGKERIHGDYALTSSTKDVNEAILDERIGELESMLLDSDNDGVPDYLDVEPNSLSGIAVDSKGRMIDLNNNGVPDQLEQYVDKEIINNNIKINASATENVLEKLFNEGYISIYFDTAKSEPTSTSSENIGYILNYLKNNPNKKVDIIGYSDETGSADFNNKLSIERAEKVKEILVKAGIDPSRLNPIGKGIDNSVDKNNKYAKGLARKVNFSIK